MMKKDQSQSGGNGLDADTGRWVAIIGGHVGAPEQARTAAKTRFKEIPQVSYIPTENPLALSPLCRRIAEIVPGDTSVYLIGGAVRDALLGRISYDLDFALPPGALKIARQVADQLGGAYYPLDSERDTARVILLKQDGNRTILDFAGLRGSITKSTTLDNDLRARDFTINAMAIDLRQPDKLLDPLGGLADLRAKKIRSCSPKAMEDDPLRVLRGVRQAAAFGFQIEAETRQFMRKAVPGLERISPERLRDELFKILGGKQPAGSVRALDMLGTFPYLLPELPALKGIQQSPPHVADVWEHTINVVAALDDVLAALAPQYDQTRANNLAMGEIVLRLGRFREPLDKHIQENINLDRPLRPLLFLAALYHDIDKPTVQNQDADGRIRFFEHDSLGAITAAARAQALHLSNAEIERLKLIVLHHMRPFHLAQDPPPTRRAIYRFFRDTDQAGIDICLLSLADFLGTYGPTLPQTGWANCINVIRSLLENWFGNPRETVSPPHLIDGNELMQALSLQSGPMIGRLLEAIREAQAVGEISDKEQALAFARNWLDVEQKDLVED